MISAIVLGSLVAAAGAGAVLSPWLKQQWPKWFAPKKGGS